MNEVKVIEVEPTSVPAYQGDVAFLVESNGREVIPASAKQVAPEAGLLIVAHSETGHHHAIAASTPGVELFMVPSDARTMWLKVPKGGHADVVHHRAWDTHHTLRLLARDDADTVFKVRRGREETPEGWKIVVD